MTETPAEEPTTPEENPPPAPEQQAVTQQDQSNQVLKVSDHKQYSFQLYEQPPYVIDGALSSASLDGGDDVEYSTDDMRGYVSNFMSPTPPPAPPEGQ